MKRLKNALVLTYKHCLDEDIPSETEAAERSELSTSVIPVEQSKEEKMTLMLSSALTELVILGKVEKISAKKGFKKELGLGLGKGVEKETEAAERSELSASLIPVEESMEEKKTMMLSSALVEVVIASQCVQCFC